MMLLRICCTGWLLAATAGPGLAAGASNAVSATVVPASAVGTPSVNVILEQFAPLIDPTPPANGMPLRVPVFSGGGGGSGGGSGSSGGTGGAGGSGGPGGGSPGTGGGGDGGSGGVQTVVNPDGSISLAVAGGGGGPSYAVTRSSEGQLQVDFN